MAAVHFPLRPEFGIRAGMPRDRNARFTGIAVAVVFHLLLVIALLQCAPARHSLAKVAPIMVSLITPPAPELPPPPPPKPVPPRHVTPKEPLPAVERPVAPPPIVGEAPAASPITVPPPVVQPPPPVAPSVIAPEPPPAAPTPITPPRFNADYLQNPAPAYPALARRMREQGRVLVRVLVSTDGAPERIELKTSSGFPRLDQSALDTIRSWKFVPARQGEQSVAAWVVVPITFSLDSA